MLERQPSIHSKGNDKDRPPSEEEMLAAVAAEDANETSIDTNAAMADRPKDGAVITAEHDLSTTDEVTELSEDDLIAVSPNTATPPPIPKEARKSTIDEQFDALRADLKTKTTEQKIAKQQEAIVQGQGLADHLQHIIDLADRKRALLTDRATIGPYYTASKEDKELLDTIASELNQITIRESGSQESDLERQDDYKAIAQLNSPEELDTFRTQKESELQTVTSQIERAESRTSEIDAKYQNETATELTVSGHTIHVGDNIVLKSGKGEMKPWTVEEVQPQDAPNDGREAGIVLKSPDGRYGTYKTLKKIEEAPDDLFVGTMEEYDTANIKKLEADIEKDWFVEAVDPTLQQLETEVTNLVNKEGEENVGTAEVLWHRLRGLKSEIQKMVVKTDRNPALRRWWQRKKKTVKPKFDSATPYQFTASTKGLELRNIDELKDALTQEGREDDVALIETFEANLGVYEHDLQEATANDKTVTRGTFRSKDKIAQARGQVSKGGSAGPGNIKF